MALTIHEPEAEMGGGQVMRVSNKDRPTTWITFHFNSEHGCGQRLIAEQLRSQRIVLFEGELVAPNQGSFALLTHYCGNPPTLCCRCRPRPP